MQHLIREYEVHDFDQVLRISKSFYDGKEGSFSLVDNIMSARMIEKYVIAEIETGLIQGYALITEQIHPGIRLRLELVVKNEFNEWEIIHDLYNKMEQVINIAAPYSIEVRLFPENTNEINFFEGKGFSENHRMVKQILDVQSANIDSYLHIESELNKNGIIIRTLAEEQSSRPDCMKLLEQLVLETNIDFPDELPSHLRRPRTDTSWLYRSEIIPEAFFIALHKGRYVGYTHYSSGPNHAFTQSFTAVCREFRNLGIATSLKLKGILYAKSIGIDSIYTSNRSTNDSMARVNEKLGWMKYDCELRMQKLVSAQQDRQLYPNNCFPTKHPIQYIIPDIS
ncbi:GNAT family N-acetyltransferase [Paenibacillus montanisoli]|uniref:GNAT family N-acetyltransferase n=1 Tax=Paenibacillus montanisoli TaxID=2081970 RepID=UPI000DDC15F8|nr:GNAT family N-acetyltransferase [Paenibacillus montanisoli]